MADKRRGLGKGLGALIPATTSASSSSTSVAERPVDVFFPGSNSSEGEDVPRETKLQMQPRRSGGKKAAKKAVSPAETATKSRDRAEKSATKPAATESSAKKVTAAKGTKTKSSEVAGTKKVATKSAKTTKAAAQKGSSTQGSPPSQVDKSDKTDTVAVEEPENGLVPVPGASFAHLEVGDIQPNPQQPRKVFDAEDMAELVHSIREIGVLQPIVVRAVAGSAGKYELIMGERRWRASQAAGKSTIPAIIRETADTDLLRDALLENLHRSELNPLEEAAAYEQLLSDFSCTHEELAARIGRSRPQITNMVRLLKLPGPVQKRLTNGHLTTGHARALLSLTTQEQMMRVSDRVIIDGLSVRATEELVASLTEPPEDGGARRRRTSSQFADLAGRLSSRFDTKVAIAMGKRKGKVTLEFQDEDELNRLMGLMAPDTSGGKNTP